MTILHLPLSLGQALIPVAKFTPWLEVRLLEVVEDADVVNALRIMSNGESGDSARVVIRQQ